jgi:hypothetical protein
MRVGRAVDNGPRGRNADVGDDRDYFPAERP